MQSHILDNLNAAGLLDDMRIKLTASFLCFGPTAIFNKEWGGTVIWYRPKGYYKYAELKLLGIWVSDNDQISVGLHRLSFSAAFFNPESYFYQIGRNFTVYYNQAVTPFNFEEIFYKTRYNDGNRLDIRRNIEKILLRRMGT